MRRRVLWVSLAVTVLSLAGVVGWVGYRDHRADTLFEGAMARLRAPLTEAPGLDRLQASTAISMLERARAEGRTDRATEGWAAYARALEDYQRGDLVLAEGELASARHRLGSEPDLDVLAAAVAAGRSQPERAEEMLSRALERAPEHVHGRLLAADMALDEEDGETAMTHLGPLLEAHPDVACLHNRIGLARELEGDLDAAMEAYIGAVERDGRAHDAWINLGRLDRRAGRHTRALEDFGRAVTAADTNGDAYLGRGLARAATGDLTGAQVDFDRAAELSPNDAEPLLALGDLLRDTGRHEEAVATYRRAIAREDADAASWLKLGNALALLEQYDESGEAFRQALERAPELAAALNGLGASLMHTGDLENATVALGRAAELDVTDPNPLMNLALLHERSGDTPAARDAWTRALERDPSSGIARRRLARL